MKRITGSIVKILLGLILFLLIVLFTFPLLFKDQIKEKVQQVIDNSVNATVTFEDYSLGFFHNFPNLSFSLNGLYVVGKDVFAGDTLAGFKSFDLVFDLSSLFSKSGYEVKSFVVDRAIVNAIALEDGTVNWDIVKDTTQTVETEEGETSSDMKIKLRKVELLNSSISYIDEASALKTTIKDFDFNLKGDMSLSSTDMQVYFRIGDLTLDFDGIKYLNRAVIESQIDVLADLDNMKFTLRENYLMVNNLKLNLSGTVEMPEEDIITDVQFGADNTSFKTLLSLIPAVYIKDYEDLTANGEFAFKGSAKGIYSEKDSTLPDVSLQLDVNNGMISYPDLPGKIENINISSVVKVDGKEMDNTTVNIDKFHIELSGNPFNMIFALKTPISDPDFSLSVMGKIDLDALSETLPMDSISMSGIIDMSVLFAGRMSMIENEEYEKFNASGTLGVKDIKVEMKGNPTVKISKAVFRFTPKFASLTDASLIVEEKSDFQLNGNIENYIPYIFSDKTIRGKLSMHSGNLDMTDIMSGMAVDTTSVEDTSALTVVQIPSNIDFEFNAQIDNFIYDSIYASKVIGTIIVRNGILSIRETGMNILEGKVTMNADYDTRDTLRPMLKADMDMQNIGVKSAFNTFNTVKVLAPAAKGIDGKVNVKMKYESLLGEDMMPVISTIEGGGRLQSDQITLLESETFDKMKGILKLGENYSNTFKDVNISFQIHNGRIYISPFDVKTGNLKMNISGDQGMDQTINYLVKTEMPRADLGGTINALIDSFSEKASSYGINYKPSDMLKINLKVTGTTSDPVISPQFGGTSEGKKETVQESAKKVVKQTIENKVSDVKDKAREEAEAKGVQLVKEAEEKAQQIRDEAARYAEQLRKEADDKANQLIKEAESKGTIAKIAANKGAESIRKTADNKAEQLVQEADVKANKLVEEAKSRKEEILKKL